MKRKLFPILLSGIMLTSIAITSTKSYANPVPPIRACRDSNDGYHHFVSREPLIVKTTRDNNQYYMTAYTCSCGEIIAASDSPETPYGSVGKYVRVDPNKINSGPGCSLFLCEYPITLHDQYYDKKWTATWHFTHSLN